MSKIFRLHTGATQDIEHWRELNSFITETDIDNIEDPSGMNIGTQITSIPTPFARMDLVKTAYKNIVNTEKLDGNTIYHKIVSDCLDVAELFFNFDSHQDKLEIIEWNSGIVTDHEGKIKSIDDASDLGRLLNSSNPKHRLLGDTLKMFLIQDADSFNFNKLKHIYLLNYKNGPQQLNIIGGTSPSTLFFTSANDLSYTHLNFADDILFDADFCPLKNRRDNFVIYMYALRKSIPGFSTLYKEINDYMDLSFEHLKPNLKSEIKNLSADFYNGEFADITVNGANNFVSVIGASLKQLKINQEKIKEENDFIIHTHKPFNGLIPCMLPIDSGNSYEELNFCGGKWQKDWCKNVPFADARPINDRTLPNQNNIVYPNLVISDLLEPHIIKVPFPIDKEKFFDGNYNLKEEDKDHGFILPIKKRFFDYFTVDELKGQVCGKKMIEIEPAASGVKVILRIPIKNNRFIQLSRIYNNNLIQDAVPRADESKNNGVIVENQFTMAIYPFIKLPEGINPHYRVMFVDRDVASTTKHLSYNVGFYNQNEPHKSIRDVISKNRSSKTQSHGVTTNYFVIEDKNFDFIEISNTQSNGVLVPIFTEIEKGSHTFRFAVDFGTTNTHIEYKSSVQETKPFDITEADIQFATLHIDGAKTERNFQNTKYDLHILRLTSILKEEFMPRIIDSKLNYTFPQRTVINDNGMFNENENTYALADFNIPFWYLKEQYTINSELTTNLKWADFTHNRKLEKRTKAFVKQLMIMMRNKVLMNKGDLSKTEIVWFYPSSMPHFRKKFLREVWNAYYKRYFPGNNKLFEMSESIAPFYYYKNKKGVSASAHPVVSIDIGGGTADVVVFTENKPKLSTSFGLGGNFIYGDGYNNSRSSNGFLLKYGNQIKKLAGTNVSKLIQIYDSIKERSSKSIELIELLFSLENNKEIKEANISISFSELLKKDEDLKLVFLFYYASIMFHISKLLKQSAIDIPIKFVFSGNGAKFLNILSSEGYSDLSALTQIIFKDTYGTESIRTMEILFENNPKELTCKGGLDCSEEELLRNTTIEKDIKEVLIGNYESDLISSKNIFYSEINDNELLESVLKENENFIDRFFEWNREFNYYENFGIASAKLNSYKNVMKTDLRTYLLDGVEEKLKDNNGNMDVNIDETLFFYPLKGVLNKLAFHIYSDTNKP